VGVISQSQLPPSFATWGWAIGMTGAIFFFKSQRSTGSLSELAFEIVLKSDKLGRTGIFP